MSEDTVVLEGVLAERPDWPRTRCSIDKAVSLVSTRSAILILREAYYGTQRFEDFVARVGVTEAVAAARLRELTDDGLLRREPYQEPGQRTRYAYRLTEMGLDLFPVLVALAQWGDKYLAGRSGPPLQWRHDGCGAPVSAVVRCDKGHDVPVSEFAVRVPPRGKHAGQPSQAGPTRRSTSG